MIVSSKIPTKLFLDFCPEIFCSFLGASWKRYGASCRLPYLIFMILLIKSPGRPKIFQEATKKIRAEILEIISLVFWKKLSFHKDIKKPTDL